MKGGEKLLKKKGTLTLALNSIDQTNINDPTILPVSFSVVDINKSGNNVIMDEEAIEEMRKTLKNKPIVAKYTDGDFSDHSYELITNDDGSTDMITTTTPIGVFTEEGSIETIDGVTQIIAPAILWKTRFNSAVSLIEKWHEDGIEINTSCEYLYSNYSFKDGIEYHHSPIYAEGHCVLGENVAPAYESSKLLSLNSEQITQFNRLVASQVIKENEQKEEKELKMFKKVNELSHDDIRVKLYSAFETAFPKYSSWISDVYETYFVANVYGRNEEDVYFDKYYKVNYSQEGETFTVDANSLVEVFSRRNWEEVVPEEVSIQLNEKDTKIEELTTQLNTITEEKTDVEGKFGEASEKLIKLNSLVEELTPFKEQLETEQMEKALNSKKDFYEAKFKALNSLDKFASEEVQDLITKSIVESEEGSQAVLQLNTMLVDLVQVTVEKTEVSVIREVASKRENLLPADDSFDSRYLL